MILSDIVIIAVSVGDAILLSKLAYRLGHTLNVDRRDAPNAFKEIQNQFLAIQNTLDSLSLLNNQMTPVLFYKAWRNAQERCC